jgi:hypothetical protein
MVYTTAHRHRLLDEFLMALREVTFLLSQQTEAIIEWDSDFLRFTCCSTWLTKREKRPSMG